jgi:mycothiol synthase
VPNALTYPVQVLIERLSATQVEAVLALAERARDHDGVDPLNEEARFSLTSHNAGHFLATTDNHLSGYLNWLPSLATAQLVVDPQHRRSGIGRTLWQQLPEHQHRAGVWAFGNLASAQGFAAAIGLSAQRGLLMMSRPLAGAVTPRVPAGLTLRGYRSDDATELLAVNAAAFAHHREQGALDAAGLAQRMAEQWFDPDGLIVAADADGIVGFHWTKVADVSAGEVYVVAVAPRAQHRGYGKLLLEAGLSHLADKGLPTVELYVDTAEEIAVRMYERAGFSEAHRDVFYASS